MSVYLSIQFSVNSLYEEYFFDKLKLCLNSLNLFSLILKLLEFINFFLIDKLSMPILDKTKFKSKILLL